MDPRPNDTGGRVGRIDPYHVADENQAPKPTRIAATSVGTSCLTCTTLEPRIVDPKSLFLKASSLPTEVRWSTPSPNKTKRRPVRLRWPSK